MVYLAFEWVGSYRSCTFNNYYLYGAIIGEEMKFKYKDKVRVIKGFYEGQEGEVKDWGFYCFSTKYQYEIKLNDCETWVHESDLEKVEEPS